MSTIRAYANCDYAYVAWRLDARVPGSRGFALLRRYGVDAPEQVVDTWVGFEDEPSPPAGTARPSTVWPIQKFMWADLLVEPGKSVSYRAVPMLRGADGQLARADDRATPWSEPVSVTPTATRSLGAYFNRGIVASQWLARRLEPETKPNTALRRIINDPGEPIRDFLSGDLRLEMLRMLERARRDGRDVYAALFELNDPELIASLTGLGSRAHVVLAAPRRASQHHTEVVTGLRQSGVDLHERDLGSRGLPHNKFVVSTDGAGRPDRVWTGSTNWSVTGLCTQANNGVRLGSLTVAGWFHEYWEALRQAGDASPDSLLAANARRRSARVGAARITTWFTPLVEQVDLEDARRHIAEAQQGILFLFFNPGPRGTLLNDIIERLSPASPLHDPALYVHGVANQDPSTATKPVEFFHRGAPEGAEFDVILPAAVNERLKFWVKELKKLAGTFAMVHSKVVVVDPFGPKPVVMTGSHNMGPKASGSNDDNLVIVENAPGLAADFAVNIMGIYNQYRWRYRMLKRRQSAWKGLRDNDRWQDAYFDAPDLRRELRFWLGEG